MANRPRPPLRAPIVAAKTAPPAAKSYQAPSRTGKRGVTFYLPENEWKELRILSVHGDVSIQELMEEAVRLLFNAKLTGKRGRAA